MRQRRAAETAMLSIRAGSAQSTFKQIINKEEFIHGT